MAQPAEAKEVWSAGKQWQKLSGEKGGGFCCREVEEKITKSAGLGNGQRWNRFGRKCPSLAKAEAGIWMWQWNSQENNRLQSHSSSDSARNSPNALACLGLTAVGIVWGRLVGCSWRKPLALKFLTWWTKMLLPFTHLSRSSFIFSSSSSLSMPCFGVPFWSAFPLLSSFFLPNLLKIPKKESWGNNYRRKNSTYLR